MDFTPFMLTALPEPYAMINRLRRAHFSMTAHTHRFWQLILVTDGVLTVSTATGAQTVAAGQVHILPPGPAHALASDGYTQLGLDLTDDDPRGLVRMLAARFAGPAVLAVGQLQLDAEMAALWAQSTDWARAQLIHRADGLLLACIAARTAARGDGALLDYLDTHLADGVRLDDAARALLTSVPQLERRCRRAYGCGVVALLGRRRLAAAQSALLETNDAVADIGRRVGFADPAHFSAFFRRHTGASPRSWRAAAQLHGDSCDFPQNFNQ